MSLTRLFTGIFSAPVINQQTRNMGSAEAIIFTIMYAITMLAALVGNSLLIFIVWKKPEVRSLTSFMFVNMAVADLLVTLVMMPWSITFFYTESNWLIKGAIGDISCRTVIFIAYVTVIASIFCLIFIAVDRSYAIAYPLRRRAWFRKPKILTPLLWMLSMALMSVIPVTSDFYSPSSKCGFNFKIWGDEQAGIRGLFIYLFVISYLIPLSIITTLYARTIQKLWYHQIRRDPLNQNLQQQRQQRQQNRKHKKVIRALVVIVVVFALCWLPAQVYHLFIAITAWEVAVPDIVMYLVYWMGHVNSAINPWLFLGFNRKMTGFN